MTCLWRYRLTRCCALFITKHCIDGPAMLLQYKRCQEPDLRILRSVLAFLLVFSLAATPVAARVAVATKAAPHTEMVKTSAMPDCHGMKIQAASAKQTSHNHCPDCNNGSPCAGGACQFKCFKVLADLPGVARIVSFAAERFEQVAQTAPSPLNLTPQPPPPRA